MHVGGDACAFFFNRLLFFQLSFLFFELALEISANTQYDDAHECANCYQLEPPALPPGMRDAKREWFLVFDPLRISFSFCPDVKSITPGIQAAIYGGALITGVNP